MTPGGGPGTASTRRQRRVYLERALINPAGPDPGHEAVVIGNLATDEVSLHGWRLIDRNGNITKLDAQIAAGASEVVTLDGTGVQLGNNGGNLILQDESGTQSRHRHLLRRRRRRRRPLRSLPAMSSYPGFGAKIGRPEPQRSKRPILRN